MSNKSINNLSKQKILSIATELFATKGFDGTSTRDICKQANINISMISYYFGGKKELYQTIIDNLIDKQKKFINCDINLNKLSKKNKIKMLSNIVDKAVDFFYSTMSDDLIIFLVREQQKQIAKLDSPILNFIEKLIANILNKKEDDTEVIFKTIFLISQISSPKIFSTFSLKKQNKKNFTNQDIQIIKNNLKQYIDFMF